MIGILAETAAGAAVGVLYAPENGRNIRKEFLNRDEHCIYAFTIMIER